MSTILIERTHALGLTAARQQAQIWADKAQAKFGVQCRYTSGETQDVLHFSGNGMDGQLRITGHDLQLQAELGFLAAMFQEKIEAKLNEQFDEMTKAA